MASIYDLKPKFQNLLRPLMRWLAGAGFSPNAITLMAIAGSIAVGAAVAMPDGRPGTLLLLPVWLFARMALNAIDGMMARELGKATSLGAVLNEVGDAVSDLGLYLPLALVDQRALWPVVAFAVGGVLTEFCGVTGRTLGASRHYEGPMGKSDRAFLVGALALLTWLSPGALWSWPWVFSAGAVLTVVTCVNRVQKALAELNRA